MINQGVLQVWAILVKKETYQDILQLPAHLLIHISAYDEQPINHNHGKRKKAPMFHEKLNRIFKVHLYLFFHKGVPCKYKYKQMMVLFVRYKMVYIDKDVVYAKYIK